MAGCSLLVVDTDPGTDDAIAFALLASAEGAPNKAFVSSYGNMPLEKTHANLRKVLSLVGLEGSLFKGSAAPLVGDVPSCGDFHGADGLGGVADLVEDTWHGPEGSLAELANKICESSAVTYITIGPLTNLARILRLRPEAAYHIKRLLTMGGGFELSNRPHGAEYNFAADPVADSEVFESGIPITLFPLDLTHRYPLTPEQIDALPLEVGSPFATMLKVNCASNMATGELGAVIHDAFPILYLGEPESFVTSEQCVRVTRWGRTRPSDDGADVEVVVSARAGILEEALQGLS